MHSKTLVATLVLTAAAVPSLAEHHVARDFDYISELVAREPLINPALIEKRPIPKPSTKPKPSHIRINMPGYGGAGIPDRYREGRIGRVHPRDLENFDILARDYDESELIARERLINPAIVHRSRPRQIGRHIHAPGSGSAGVPHPFGYGLGTIRLRDFEELEARNRGFGGHGHSGQGHWGQDHGQGHRGHYGHRTPASEGASADVGARSLNELD